MIAPQTLTTAECVVCGSTELAAPLYRGIVRCPACGYVSADMRLTDEELFALYNEQFFTGAEFSDYAADERFFRKNFRLRFRELRKFLDPARHKHLLEIGSAYGFFLDEVRAEFESVEGIDITDAGVAHAREHFNLNVVQADFLAHDYGAQKFDVVCMCEILEHLDEPEEVVASAFKLLKPGGRFILTCPHDNSIPDHEHVRVWGHDDLFHLLATYAREVTFVHFPPPYFHVWMMAHVTKPKSGLVVPA